MTKMLSLPFDEYQADIDLTKAVGHGEGVAAETKRLKPLIDYIEMLTAITIDGPGRAAHFTNHQHASGEGIQTELRRLLFAVGHYS